MINLLLFALALVWPLGQLLLLTPVSQPARLHLLDLLVIILIVRLVFDKKFWRLFLFDPLTVPLTLFATAACISLIIAAPTVSGARLVIGGLYLTRFLAYWSVYYALRLFPPQAHQTKLATAALIFTIGGFFQYLFYPDLRFLKAVGYDDHFYRLIGAFFDPNFTGLVLVVLFLLSLNSRRPAVVFLRSLVLLLAIGLTFSRAAFLTLAFGLTLFALIRKQLRWLVFLLLLGFVVYFVPKPFGEGVNLGRTFSIISRLETNAYALRLFQAHPFTGVGFNLLKSETTQTIPSLSSGIDNSYLFVLATTGIFGLAAFLYLLYTAVRSLRGATLTAVLAVLFHSLFNNTFFYSWILILFLTLVARRPKEQTSA